MSETKKNWPELAERIKEHEERVKARLKAVWEQEDMSIPAVIGSWSGNNAPQYTVKERIFEPEKDLSYQWALIEQGVEALEAGFDDLPSLFPYFGVPILQSAFGCRVDFPEDKDPWSHFLIHQPEEVYSLQPLDLRKGGLCPAVLERIEYYQEQTDGLILIRCTDTQSPIDVATQIWHYEDMLTAMFTNPDEVHYLMNMVTETLIAWLRLQEKVIDNFFGFGHLDIWHPRGVGMSDDVAAVLSPATYREFAKPYNQRLSREFGGSHYHACRCYAQNLENIAGIEGFTGLDASSEYHNAELIEQSLAGRGIWTGVGENSEALERLRGKVGMVTRVSGESKEEAVSKLRRIRPIEAA